MTLNEKESLTRPKPVVLCILDGWGERRAAADNAVSSADTPNLDKFRSLAAQAGMMSRLQASEDHVGLPHGQMGNSEVGHTNIGAGRVVMQDLPRINAAVADGTLATNPALKYIIDRLKASGGTCHLAGLLSPGGVHSHSSHLMALTEILSAAGIPVAIHAFLDGRDTPPKSGLDYMTVFLSCIEDLKGVRVATVCGRYYAMDRDNRWDRVEQAYRALVDAEGGREPDALAAITGGYGRGETDEFIRPSVIGDYGGMNDGDGLLMANFRADRAREILTALVDPGFDGFQRTRKVDFAARLGMISYSSHLDGFLAILFPSGELKNILGEVVADAGMKQLRIAETEKYAHVTFFFNGGRERVFDGEERIMVPSPKVATYDLKPEMSAVEVTDRLVEAIAGGTFDLIIVNYANGDMVGHSGVMAAAIKAVETVDACLGSLNNAVTAAGGVLLVTADHGNCEQMQDNSKDTSQPHTAHTINPVPLIMLNAPPWVQGSLRDGALSDIAPTLLALMGLEQPAEMTGRSLIDGRAAP